MAIFNCKMCGGNLEVKENMSVGTCEYCGSTMTLPKLNNDLKENLYDRANHLRRNNDYDKAMALYEKILNEDTSDAEAYWSLVLCKYGIEYVVDPATNKRIPTCNRTQFLSIFADEDYKAAISNADVGSKVIYEEEAKRIDVIQKGILEIANKEEKFDVFICYKESDDKGVRTVDSVIAQELYYGLTNEGLKVFFARITLEDKLGVAYEPYIFSALNSSKAMVVLGTKKEHFNATWVKNEWARYLSLIKKGDNKVLIPAYKNMDPYDLPEEFSHLQAQDMSKLGFMQDIIRGINKIAGNKKKKSDNEERESKNTNSSIEPLLNRAFLCLEDRDFKKADELVENVLNQDPYCGKAYLVKLMARTRSSEEKELINFSIQLDECTEYNKAIRFLGEEDRNRLQQYNTIVTQKLAAQKKERENSKAYDTLIEKMKKVSSEDEYAKLIKGFIALEGYNDSKELADKCQSELEKIIQHKKKIEEEKARAIEEEARLLKEKEEEERIEKQRKSKELIELNEELIKKKNLMEEIKGKYRKSQNKLVRNSLIAIGLQILLLYLMVLIAEKFF